MKLCCIQCLGEKTVPVCGCRWHHCCAYQCHREDPTAVATQAVTLLPCLLQGFYLFPVSFSRILSQVLELGGC